MRLVFTPLGWEDHRYWQATDKGVLAGCLSRRIDEEHRIVLPGRNER
jgi:Txe/YoeB family toxin of Txe-Axe toxin-antitoxin module